MWTDSGGGQTGKKPSGIERGLSFISEHTFALKEKLWMENIAENLPVIRGGRDIRELPKCNGSAVVIGAGPSVERFGHLRLLRESGYKGAIVACDKILVPCLKAGMAPDIVITADGDPKIAKFYDYEPVRNNGKTKAVLNVITHPDTISKVPYEKFWYMTPYDDPLEKKSISRAIHFMTRKTILSSLGNVGGQAFNLCYFLGADPVILVGLDYGYPGDMPLADTSYYRTYAELARRREGKVERYFRAIRNPETNESVVLDMNWAVYRELFLRHAERARCRIVNCSPVSSLFGKNITQMPLGEALERWGR